VIFRATLALLVCVFRLIVRLPVTVGCVVPLAGGAGVGVMVGVGLLTDTGSALLVDTGVGVLVGADVTCMEITGVDDMEEIRGVFKAV
jgi:hypothetical protein